MQNRILSVFAFVFLLLQQTQAQVEVHSGRNSQAWQALYRETAPRINDLVHTRLDLTFDYSKAWAYGKAWITLQPHFYDTDSLALDAKGMDIKSVSMMKPGNKITPVQSIPLQYKYDGMILNVSLNKKYKGGEMYTVYIEYIAKPNEITAQGSAAITDAKGLYFINPDGSEKGKPIQIWTQGETEATSVWCPTIDKPNQKTTQEIYMTVPQQYVTLSNGMLINQKKNNNGTRTDYWKMDLPHAPYLFFMGVGDYAVVKDSYKGKEVSYYVEKQYAPVARKIFGNTPEMMAFFGKITGIEYPWPKYAQIVGRDYVSGAMENTTATLHQESAQQDARELIDGNRWEAVIAHELFHHWFGDYVTAESWSNLTLNESFANYSETLWEEYKNGKDAGDEQNYNDMTGYLRSGSAQKDLVRFYYKDKEDMFDAVSYNKGGRILHMLRNYIGDSAFNKTLNNYLTTNKFKSAEAHQLRMAFEEVTGKDLNWFFNQWYFGAGHPKLDISYKYDDAAKQVNVLIRQTQDGDKIFRLPIAIDVYNGASKKRYNVEITEKEQTFTLPYATHPDLVNVDADKILLCEKKDDKTLENFIHQYKYATNYLDRREAIEACAKQQQQNNQARELMKLALKDKYHGLRILAINNLDMRSPAVKEAVENLLADLAKNDKKSTVRAAAIRVLTGYNKPAYTTLFANAVTDSSYSVAGEALAALLKADNALALKKAQQIKTQSSKGKLAEVVSSIIINAGSEEDFDYVATQFDDMPLGDAKFTMLQPFADYLGKLTNTQKLKKGVDYIVKFRDAIPAAYRDQTNTFINNMILNGIITRKKTMLTGSHSAAIQEQIDYIKSKI